MSLKNFVVKNGLTVGSANIDAATGNLFSGNANLGNLATANYFSGNGSLLSSITGANVTGQVANALVAGTVYTNAQPNITSVGTLTGLTVGGVTSLGPNGNVIITGGTNGQFLSTNGSGNLSWTTIVTSGVSNGTSNIAIPVADGNINSSVGGVANVFVVASTGANVTGTFNATGNANVGNIGATNGVFTTIAGTLSTASQPNITSVGSLTSLTLAANGNITMSGSDSQLSGANLVSASYLTGTLTTAAQPNITSVGTLTSLDVTNDATVGGNVVTNTIKGKTTGVTITATGTNQNINLQPTGTGVVDVNGAIVANLATPNAATDAATKGYVDAAVTSLHVHDSCYVATTGTLDAASGGTVSYNNGTLGVGATLTTTGTYLLIDGGNVQTVGTRILVKNEANAAWNGIYVYTSTTVLTRASDFDTSAEAAGGDFVFVTSGSTQADTGWVQTTDNPTLGTSNIVWTQFSGAGTYTAGTGLTLTGTVFSITNTAVSPGSYGGGDVVGTFTVNQQGQLTAAANAVITANAANLTGTTLASGVVNSSLTSVGTLGSLTVSSNITAGNIGGANLVSANYFTGTLTTAAQPNITSVGSLTSLTIAANGNITMSGSDSQLSGGNLVSATYVAGTLTTAAQPNITSVGTLTSATVTGNVVAGNVYANSGTIGASLLTGTLTTASQPNVTSVGSLTSLTIAANGNITMSGSDSAISGGNAVSATYLTGTLTTAAQPNVTSVGTLTSLNSSGNITAPNIVANTGSFYGNASGLTSIPGANVTGQVANALVAGTVYTAAQPNITSVGTLTSLTLTANGNITMSGSDSQLSGGNLVSATYLTGTLTTAAQPNITSVGTLTSLTTSGNVVVGGNVKVQVGITSNRANVSVTNSATVIDEFAPSSWRTAKYVISASGADGYQSVETLLVHDGVDAYITIYGSICSNVSADIVELSANINGVTGNVTVYAVSNSASCIVNLVSSYIKT